MGARTTAPAPDEWSYTPMAEINMTPFVDVMLVLLVIFMVTAPLMMSGVPLQLPKSAAARLTPPSDPLVVSVDGTGRLFLGNEAMTADALRERLKDVAQTDPDRVVHVRGESALPYGQVMEVVGGISAVGLRKVTMIAHAAKSAPTEGR